MSKEKVTGWTLVAQNEQGAMVSRSGDTKNDVLNQFDKEYYRKGWKIFLYKFSENGSYEYFTKTVLRKGK